MAIIQFAHTNGIAATQLLSREEQKRLGQFMTPPCVASFMAQRCLPPESMSVVRILDPAAGAGILAAAVVEALLDHNNPPAQIFVILYELDLRLIPALRLLAGRMRKDAKKKNIVLSVSIRQGDFLLSPVAVTQQPIADIIISNPPYFKISALDPRAKAHSYAVYGQPNIYSLFMAACTGLLAPSGRWCFITPRSWTNGLYFEAMRRHVFRCLHIDAMHVFGSRRAHFTEDEILQEAMITWATTKAHSHTDVVVSTSEGSRDIAEARLLRLPLNQIVGQDEAQMIVLPNNTGIKGVSRWTSTLATYGLKVSTGPVVAFRAADHISEKPSAKSVPLLWMQHITHMKVSWPIDKKREHIVANGKSAWMLIPNDNLVMMRRFSPKEDQRRITAAPYISRSIPGDVLGLENHTNYIYRPGGHMTAQEALGIAAYLNSRIVDQYLRAVAGNTQVNATDLRKLPLPPKEVIMEIGRIARVGMSLAQVDKIIDKTINGMTPNVHAVGEM